MVLQILLIMNKHRIKEKQHQDSEIDTSSRLLQRLHPDMESSPKKIGGLGHLQIYYSVNTIPVLIHAKGREGHAWPRPDRLCLSSTHIPSSSDKRTKQMKSQFHVILQNQNFYLFEREVKQ